MEPELVKTGSCSIVIGQNHYRGFVPVKLNKLFKITKINDKHSEFKHLSSIKKINNYQNYFIVPDEPLIPILKGESFHNFLKTLINENMSIFNYDLKGFYINFGGKMDVHDSIIEMDLNQNSTIWKNPINILDFCRQIMKGISYLHEMKLCHLDIKPENIMIFTPGPIFKIIDFGFCEQEPFEHFLDNIRGTPGYFPRYDSYNSLEYLPEIEANDFMIENGTFPYKRFPKLIYKIDTFCFGRTLLYLYDFYKRNITPECSCFNGFRHRHINNIIDMLLEKNVYKRLTIKEILQLV